jgi:membrane protease YdiL (CAAX protease family)
MDTPIARHLQRPISKAWCSALIGTAVVAADLVLAPDHWILGIRTLLPLVGLVALLILANTDRPSLGLRLTPIQGWTHWFRLILIIGLIVGAVSLVLLFLGRQLGYTIEIGLVAPVEFARRFQMSCVESGIIEEATYRLVLCTATAAILGFWPAVALSGLVFGYLHVRYGCAAPDNLIAGFFLGWAYLRSGTFVIPVLMHALGNLCVLLLQLTLWCRQAGLF